MSLGYAVARSSCSRQWLRRHRYFVYRREDAGGVQIDMINEARPGIIADDVTRYRGRQNSDASFHHRRATAPVLTIRSAGRRRRRI